MASRHARVSRRVCNEFYWMPLGNICLLCTQRVNEHVCWVSQGSMIDSFGSQICTCFLMISVSKPISTVYAARK